jgi:lipoate-protein ligase A
MNSWRLVETPAARGDWNMAVDAALLESAAARNEPCLRFYSWCKPTVSLGYFQDYDSRTGHPPSVACPLVRRSTGGGAIVHDAEITYSFVTPVNQPEFYDAGTLYRSLHGTLVAALADWGLAATIHERAIGSRGAPEPFLCFQRRATGDVLLDGWKIAGSAQRRRRGAILQHGSVLLRRSIAAPELPGLADLAGIAIEPRALIAAWRESLAREFHICWMAECVEPDEVECAACLVDEVYGNDAWTRRR